MRKPATRETELHGKTRVPPASTTLLASLVHSSDDAIDSKTLDGIITSWNRAAEQMYGYSANEILGNNISMLSHPDRPEEMDEILQRIRNGERVEHYETVRVRKDGRRISISITVSPILDGAGKVVGVSSIARDVTERTGATKTLLASIVNSSDDAIDSKTLNGIITS
jgi:PAS domain S-box-containing protein